MAIPITIPRLGWNMEEGVFVGWLKADGAAVQAGETLFTLENEKATEDVECLDSGILHIPAKGPRKGDTLAVGALIGYLLQPGEAIPESEPRGTGEPPVLRGTGDPAARGTGGSPVQPSRHAIPPTRVRPTSSPRARRAAARLGIDWTQAIGTGRFGRIRESDVVALSKSTGEPPVPRGATRRVIAERILSSHLSTAPVTLTTTVDATELVQVRKRWKSETADTNPIPTYTDLFIKLAASALAKHPALNSRWENDRIVTLERIHIGIAVDTDAGLLVPVIRDVPDLDLKELSSRSRDLIERARLGELAASEMRGGTFTVTSLGAFGIDAFTPIINPPECAILGIGRIRPCPAVVDGQVVICDQVTLSLTFDHRIVDGAPAARFLETLSRLIERYGDSR